MKLKHVILECPYDSWFDAGTQKLFCKTIGLRLTGYLREYPYGVLPFDTSDFVAAHHLICKDEQGDFEPVMCWKSLSLERCNTHNLAFPPLAALRTLDAPRHLKTLESILERFKASPASLSYGGGITIRPDLRTDRELVSRLWEMMKAGLLSYDLEKGVKEAVCFSAVRFKMYRIFEAVGYREFEDAGTVLPPLSMPSQMNGHAASLFHRKEISAEGLRLVEKYRNWWDERILIRASQEMEKKSA